VDEINVKAVRVLDPRELAQSDVDRACGGHDTLDRELSTIRRHGIRNLEGADKVFEKIRLGKR